MNRAALLLSLLLVTPALAQTPTGDFEAKGTFRPAGPPGHVSRSQIGDDCVVDLVQGYTLDGALSGSMQIDFRIFVAGPCGMPPGTYDEHWIARGEYVVRVGDSTREGPLVYLAEVKAGGGVEGRIRLADGLRGTLMVGGRFRAGFMRYRGKLTQ